MIAVALKGLAARKVRALLTALAVVIGVSMVSGTFILTDTMQKTFDGLFAASYEETDAVIAGKQIVDTSTSGSATIPESLLTKVQALPEVEAASGTVSPAEVNAADIIGRDGDAVAQESLGASIDPANARFSPFKLKSGDWPAGPEQVVIDAGTASKEHYKTGDTVQIETATGRHDYRVTGIASYGEVDSLGFGSFAVWDVETAQAVLDPRGSVRLDLARREGGHVAGRAGPRRAAAGPGHPRGQGQRQAGRRGLGAARRGDVLHPLLPARLRRHRAVRRRVRDLQHPVDHGRPAHARVRDPADARRLAQAGAALRPARGARRSACSPR